MSRYSFEAPEYGGGGMPQLQFPRLTPAVKWIMITCAGVQLLQLIGAGWLSDWLGVGVESFSSSRLYVLGLLNLLTYQFVHSYADLGHILMNMLVLYFFGTMVEEGIGTGRFLRLYLLAGVAGALFWIAFSLIMGIRDVCIGASGACFGVMTYAAFMRPNARVIFIIVLVRLWWLAAMFGLIAVYKTMLALRHGAAGGVADAAHVGGMAFAALWWRYAAALSRLGDRLEARATERNRRHAVDRAREVDRLLAKIKEVGMNGLTPAERRFLRRYSEDQKR